ncbi:CRISPR-associated helicase Cas3' [Streptomyces sp. NPDC059991]|uniref:CRISPR-associated helicase Cas3' n=1 Tax=Streptomyces sp. NPDC059991 TaxID=3347028 RepID=UPI0036AE1231
MLWAKTWRAGWGRDAPPGELWHSLVAHGWDSGHAAGWLWDGWIPVQARRLIAADLDGRDAVARSRLMWLAATHDFGKATPVFQGLDTQRAAALVAAGLPVDAAVRGVMPHGELSGRLMYKLLCERGWDVEAAEWVALALAGHHGVFPRVGWLASGLRARRVGTGAWVRVREEVYEASLEVSGASAFLDDWAGGRVPSVAAQLVQAGAVTLADWLASNEELFPYAASLPEGYAALSRQRVSRADVVLGMQKRWLADQRLATLGPAKAYRARFGVEEPRHVQSAVYDLVASSVSGPGLLLVEAPMGEGKTEAALMAAEMLAARLGANGVFFGLPTQATANQIFRRVLQWLKRQGAGATVALAHGKAARQEDYRALLRQAAGCVGVDEGGANVAASHWVLGRYRALLAPVVVATVDQLLLAGLASRYVSVRMLGLAGKVVVLDEVHAYDAHMSVLLGRVLAWLGACGVPVVLLSATLSQGQRAELVAAYAGERVQGAHGSVYPRLTWVPAPGVEREAGQVLTVAARSTQKMPVKVELLPEPGMNVVADRVEELLAEGGCLLVLRNTVVRAQELAEELRMQLGEERVTLMHARFTVADRRRLEDLLVKGFGRDGTRPMPHVVVATQVVEQSLDVSFDALITDLCPVDLMFQRIGRMHRHLVEDRPSLLAEPRVVITGFEKRKGRPPRLPRGSAAVYGEHLLWRTAAAVFPQAQLALPEDIPRLVDLVYSTAPVGPAPWQEELATAAEAAEELRRRMRAQAQTMALKSPHVAETLADLHDESPLPGDDDETAPHVQALVRLGRPSVEVILLRATSDGGQASTLSAGPSVTVPLDRLPDAHQIETILEQAIRLPSWPAALSEAAEAAAVTPAGWKDSAWLSAARVLLLPADGSPLLLAGAAVDYAPTDGLRINR